MLTRSPAQQGVSLIELVIGLAIVAALMAAAAPSFATWIQNSKIRTTADALLNGLQLARAEAVRRNTPVRFSLTDAMDNSCALSSSGTNWVVSLDDPTGKCGIAPSETTDPRTVAVRPGAEGSTSITVAADQSEIRFSGLGRKIPDAAATGNVNINISNTAGGTCAAVGGPMRCLRIVVSAGGQVRMCDPALSTTGTDVRRCES